MKKCLLSITLMGLLLILLSGVAVAQAYTFNIPQEAVNVFWNEDGSVALDYLIVFNNDPGAHAIDYVDMGMPNSSFADSSITADVNGVKVTDISRSGFQGSGTGFAVGLGSQAISPGSRRTLHVNVGKINYMLKADNQQGMGSAVFAPAWYTTAHGWTNLTVIFHFPKGVGANDATFHETQPGWTGQPVGSVDEQGLVTFTWNNPQVVMNHEIDFGASFPSTHIPVSPPTAAPAPASTGSSSDNGGTVLIILMVIIGAVYVFFKGLSGGSTYVSPTVSVQGYGIKRGLTAVEAAVVLKEPLDKILTMILFSVVKKGAAEVVTSDPLDVKVIEPLPEGLQTYETQFLNAFKNYTNEPLQGAIEAVMVGLFKSVNEKMQGYSSQPTIEYYRSVFRNAWAEVEAAGTPEVTSQKFEEQMDWTMLDSDFTPHTERLFANQPLILPAWWSHYDPTYRHTAATVSLPSPVSVPGPSGLVGAPAVNTPVSGLPGSDFAASIVKSTQNLSNKVAGDLSTFTQGVLSKAAPPPPPPPPEPMPSSWTGSSSSSSYHPHTTYHPHPSGGGGHHCACACAGGGR